MVRRERRVTVWKAWYLISQNGATVGYFEETAERRPAEKQISITQRWVEKMDGKALEGFEARLAALLPPKETA